ncbi:MAG: restriction endonuclease subunit S [Acidiferrobacteraceae bacterium]
MEVKEASADYVATADPRVPVGYKQTEVGVIPEDWHLMSFIGAVGAYIDYRGRTPRKLGLSWGGGDILALSANNVQMGKINLDKEAYLGNEKLYRKWMVQGECEQDDILLTMEAPLGNVAQIPDSRKYILSQRVLLIKPKEWVLRAFLAHYMRGSYFQKQLDLNSTGSTAKGIQRKKLDEVPVYIPPTKAEQEAIAEVLSDADALIESLEQLLTKKRRVKQGAMQELLTGKTRLPGFSGGWEASRLEALADIRGGGTPSTTQPQFWDSDIPWCTPTDITKLNGFKYLNDTSRKISLEGLKSSSAEMIPENSIVMTSRATIGECAINRVPVSTNQGFKNFIPFDHVDVEFLYYLLLTQKQSFISLCGGSTFLELSKTQIAVLEVNLPTTKTEQTAIATILSDMDAELAELDAKLAKTRAIKQAMMQELLTGRIRLVRPTSTVDQAPLASECISPVPKSRNWQINEAVVISVLAKHFGSEQWPLGRKRYTKLSYLLHRYVEGRVKGYLKKAAGPYNPGTRYKGPEQIALKNRYVRFHSRDTFSGFVAAEKISEAEAYFSKWYGEDVLAWLERFRLKSNDELELLATVDMAMNDLRRAGEAAELATVKKVIQGHREWAAKLDRAIFSDNNIRRTLESCQQLFTFEETEE